MSYILDALQKADRDRDLARVPGLETVHSAAPGRTRRVGIWALAVAFLAGAGVPIWLLISTPNVQRSVPGEAPVARGTQTPEGAGDLHRALARLEAALAPPSSPQQTVAATPETGRKEKAPGPPRRGVSGAGSVPALPTAPASPDLRPVRPHSVEEPPAEPRSVQGNPAGSQGDTSPIREQVQTTPAAADAQRPQAQPVGQGDAPREEPVARAAPPAPESGPTLQEAVAKMKLGVFVYTDVKAKRMVVIDGRNYGEGDLVGGRYLVEAITSEGVLLSCEGERALLKP